MIETDELIYRRFLNGHSEADLRILLERHRESLILFLNGYVHNLADAEELMLDAYAQAAAGAGFSGKSSFKTWLFAIGKKLALARLRKNRHSFAPPEERTDGTAPPPELELLQNEQNRQLYQALAKLKDDHRQALILLYFEQMSYAELGAVLGKSRKQVYNLAERGRAALKEELERMGFDHAQYG